MPTDPPTTKTEPTSMPLHGQPLLEWDWDIEHADRRRETRADAALHHHQHPFQVDRKVLKDVVREQMNTDVGRIKFLSSGTFHKAYLVTLVDHFTLIARVARRFMPRLKTESEVATMRYLRENTGIPVPAVYCYDSNPYNRLGGEYILMSKAEGVSLSQVFHSMAHGELLKLLDNLALLVIPLFAHRFSKIGSLYEGTDSVQLHSAMPTPKPRFTQNGGYPFDSITVSTPRPLQKSTFHIGPIISWPFFGSNRGELSHPNEIDRGPWETTAAYLTSCAEREIDGVRRENEGSAAPHRLHLDPDEVHSSRHHHLKSVPGDESDESDEWDWEESEGEEEGPGDAMYRDYRRMQRGTFLFAHLAARVETVRGDMERWKQLMTRLAEDVDRDEFGIDCHDISLENVFVDKEDHSKITCVIDWEATTVRPLWACAHLPSFLQSSPFIAELFRCAVRKLTKGQTRVSVPNGFSRDLGDVAREWLHFEAKGTRLRMAHRCVEWDGWEEGLFDSILGPVEQEEEWSRDYEEHRQEDGDGEGVVVDEEAAQLRVGNGYGFVPEGSPEGRGCEKELLPAIALKPRIRLPFATEKEKVMMLDTTGDVCGGRGGELGRRLEAWLHVSENKSGSWRRGVEQDLDGVEQIGCAG